MAVVKHSSSWSPRTAGCIALGLLVAAPLLAAPPRKAPPRKAPARPPAAKAGPTVQKRRPGLVEVMPVTPRAAQEVARLTALAKQGAWDDWLRQYQRLVED